VFVRAFIFIFIFGAFCGVFVVSFVVDSFARDVAIRPPLRSFFGSSFICLARFSARGGAASKIAARVGFCGCDHPASCRMANEYFRSAWDLKKFQTSLKPNLLFCELNILDFFEKFEIAVDGAEHQDR
jgi:hypothetical protein